MRALIIDTATTIAPFGDPAGDALLLFSTVREEVDRALADAGLEVCHLHSTAQAQPGDDERLVVIADRVFISRKALGDFLAAAADCPRAALALRRTPSVDFTLPVTDLEATELGADERSRASGRLDRLEREAVQRVVHDVYLVRGADLPKDKGGLELLGDLRKRCTPVLVDKRELGIPVRLPVLGSAAAQTMRLPLTSTVVTEMRHWAHILWLNQVAFGMRWMDLLRANKLWALSRALRAFPWSRASLFKSFVRVGKRCRIHPTAHVELSELGDDVVIGPRASVRNSFVGDGVEIGDHAAVLSSTVGAGSFITPRTFLIWSAVYPGATIGNYKLQVSVIGRDAHINPWAGLIDAKFQGDLRVELDGVMRSTGRSFLGSCVGHRAAVAAKILIQPGRMIPNDTVIVMRPDEVVAELPEQLPQGEPLVRHQGTLVPLRELLPERLPAQAIEPASD